MADLVITAASVVRGEGANVEQGWAAASFTAGNAMYQDDNGLWDKADALTSELTATRAKGIALNGGAANQPVFILTSGLVTIGATMTAGTAYYLSATAGGICPFADVTTGMYVVQIGLAVSTTVLDVDIKYPNVVV